MCHWHTIRKLLFSDLQDGKSFQNQGCTQGEEAEAAALPLTNWNLKNADFVDAVMSNLYVTEPSAESATEGDW